MRDLDAQETYLADRWGLVFELRDLVGSGPSPQVRYTPPFGVVGFGEGWWAALLARDFAPEFTQGGTQFVLEGGYDFGGAMGMELYAALDGAEVVRLGFRENAEVEVPPHPLSTYRYLRFLLLATGQQAELRRIDQALLRERERLRPEVGLDKNPAKFLAYALLERIPLWVVPERYLGLAQALQQVFGRIGKSLSITPPPSALEFFVTSLEARHEQGDPIAAVLLGDDERKRYAQEILESRVDILIELPEPEAEGTLAKALCYWYRLAWASYYLALLYGVEPGDTAALHALRRAT
ncbi:mannose-6-phosphate isomerase [Meiothermus sp. QL-1]|uniref:SIS domain-containing protein n=1 Tax=Meiothermus sp. QL-1 TaxID=2058095 RepID=UPI000E0C0F48|nr:SIS domain-containing protein [Meiothermus sp. QL-1]RDI94717.1 mannose-6-phosphate isomerase [Meiothermus sp. QL-1]